MSVQYILPLSTSKAILNGFSNPVMRVLVLEPSKSVRWILPVLEAFGLASVQYIFPPSISKARPAGFSDPVMRVSMLEPFKLVRWISPLPTSVQYICDKTVS